MEPILVKNNKRFTLFPIEYPDLWALKEIQKEAHWVATEIDYEADNSDWKKLTPDEKYFIENILAFFAGADGIVMENLNVNFAEEVQIPEARAFYALQEYMESEHSETYSRLIEAFVDDSDRALKLLNAIDEIPCVKRKAEWAQKWMSRDKSFAERLIGFLCMEGIFFSGSFCSIFWLKSRGLMTKTLGHSNELIARDEALHCNFAIALYKHLEHKLSKEQVHKIFKEAVTIEREFIVESLPCRLIGMNSDLMTQYIKYVADYWSLKLGLGKIYSVENPFNFMDLNNLDGKSNFFEKRVSDYGKAKKVEKVKQDLKFDQDF